MKNNELLPMKTKFNLLTSELFIIGMIIILVNDFYLKYTFSNFITGKLSDFAGLFTFPFFISIFLPKYAKQVYISTLIFFVFWKLEISETFINFLSYATNLAFYRTVDTTDLIALVILPFSYRYYRIKELQNKKSNFIINSSVGIIFFFTALADSQPRQSFKDIFKINKTYSLELNRKEFVKRINSGLLGYTIIKESDSVIAFCFKIPKYNAEAKAVTIVREGVSKNLIIRVDSISEVVVHGKLFSGIKSSDIENCKNNYVLAEQFKQNCIDELLKDKKRNSNYYAYSIKLYNQKL